MDWKAMSPISIGWGLLMAMFGVAACLLQILVAHTLPMVIKAWHDPYMVIAYMAVLNILSFCLYLITMAMAIRTLKRMWRDQFGKKR